MIRISIAGVLVALLAYSSFAAEQHAKPPAKPPSEVISAPVAPTHPVDVNVVSAPPAQVSVSNWPTLGVSDKDVATGTFRLVWATWFTGGATLLAVIVALHVASRQSRDTQQRDHAALVREVNRAAHKVMITATRLKQLASDVVPTRNHLHVLLHQGGMPAPIKQETEDTLRDRHTALDGMVSAASASSAEFHDLEALSDKELSKRIWKLDVEQARLDAMEATITRELEKYESESSMIRQQNTTMHAAVIGAKMSQPPKDV